MHYFTKNCQFLLFLYILYLSFILISGGYVLRIGLLVLFCCARPNYINKQPCEAANLASENLRIQAATMVVGPFHDNSAIIRGLQKTSDMNGGVIHVISDDCKQIKSIDKNGQLQCIDIEKYIYKPLPKDATPTVKEFRKNLIEIYTKIKLSDAENKHRLYPFLKDLLQIDYLYHNGGVFFDADNPPADLLPLFSDFSLLGLKMANCHNPSIIGVDEPGNPIIFAAMANFNQDWKNIKADEDGKKLLDRFFNEAFAGQKIGLFFTAWVVPREIEKMSPFRFNPVTDNFIGFYSKLLKRYRACFFNANRKQTTSGEPSDPREDKHAVSVLAQIEKRGNAENHR